MRCDAAEEFIDARLQRLFVQQVLASVSLKLDRGQFVRPETGS